MLINRILQLAAFIILVSTGMNAQYISGVTIPDVDPGHSLDPDDISVRLSRTITSDDMRMHLTILASDNFEGRETGEKGNEMAADYLAKYLEYMGYDEVPQLESYFQPVNFTFSKWEETVIHVNDQRYKHLWDYLNFPNRNSNMPELESDEVIYLGYGIDDGQYSDYKGVDVRDKVIMITGGEPMKNDSISKLSGSTNIAWTSERKLKLAKEKGVKLVLIIEPDIKKMLGENRRFLLRPNVDLAILKDENIQTANHAYISSTVAKAIIGDQSDDMIKVRKMIDDLKPKSLVLKTSFSIKQDKKVKYIQGNNVLGYIEGADPKLKEEVLVVSAHYDHLGKRGDDVYNGADDNGSGTTTVIELSEAFMEGVKQGHRPKRSVLFLWVTGEEKGLLGSEYYSNNPIFSLENTIADINIDMVGRVDEKYKDNPNYIYVIGSDRLSTELHEINEALNNKYERIVMDYKYNDENDPNRYYYRSDHYNFAEKGIPSIFFFNGTHEDYHLVSDTVEKINFEKMEKIGRHFFHLAWELANRDERIKADKLK